MSVGVVRPPDYTSCVTSCYDLQVVAKHHTRVNIVLDEERAIKLERLAERTHLNAGTLARSLLSSALDEADPDPGNVTALLDAIDGAWERASLGLEEARAGLGKSLGEL
jgi:hypothetical protein